MTKTLVANGRVIAEVVERDRRVERRAGRSNLPVDWSARAPLDETFRIEHGLVVSVDLHFANVDHADLWFCEREIRIGGLIPSERELEAELPVLYVERVRRLREAAEARAREAAEWGRHAAAVTAQLASITAERDRLRLKLEATERVLAERAMADVGMSVELADLDGA